MVRRLGKETVNEFKEKLPKEGKYISPDDLRNIALSLKNPYVYTIFEFKGLFSDGTKFSNLIAEAEKEGLSSRAMQSLNTFKRIHGELPDMENLKGVLEDAPSSYLEIYNFMKKKGYF